jgi:ATP-dependent DNA helicase DinG
LEIALANWVRALEPLAAGRPELEQCVERARVLAGAIAAIAGNEAADSGGARAGADGASTVAAGAPTAAAGARTIEVSAHGFTLSLLPYDISTRFRALVTQRPSAWVFTSATLAVAGNFGHFSARLGLADAATLCVDSPFDYERQALLYLPRGLPDPADPRYTDAVLDAALPLLEAAGGGAFLLFTSHRALGAAARRLRGAALPGATPLLVQGAAPRELLLRRFRESGKAVLLGTASFWEGVDVQGAALRLVLIDKLPFAPVDDPQVRARVEFLQAQGANAFRDYQLPEAALALKQGVGRLIRSEEDRGVVVICDPRLATRGYGKVLLASLPPMRLTRDAQEACALLRQCAREFAALAPVPTAAVLTVVPA